jgi:phosphopantothenoylcysteine decarboxylase/phosphopantothenate--cysteine ligase
MMLRGKKVILGVCGSIAVYKAAYLTRLLIKEGAEVQVILTSSASSFIGPLTFSTLTGKPVYDSLVKNEAGEWNNHVEMALWADLLLIAPASANTLCKMAQGACDNLLTAVYLSAKCPVMVAPAMDLDMYRHPATKANLERLKSYGTIVIDAEYGFLASGLEGEGRLAEPEHITEVVKNYFQHSNKLHGRKVVVTAGPTYEPLDPVRFIGNHSTGKMGYEIAHQLDQLGASVTLISGPTSLKVPSDSIQFVKVQKAEEMYNAVMEHVSTADAVILSAAVADYTPKEVAAQKIKKKEGGLSIDLVKTKDIAAAVGAGKKSGQVVVGFALETENELDNAFAKLESKNLDFIVLNSLNDQGAGFGHDTNKVTFIDRNNKVQTFELKSKKEVASDIISELVKHLEKKKEETTSIH